MECAQSQLQSLVELEREIEGEGGEKKKAGAEEEEEKEEVEERMGWCDSHLTISLHCIQLSLLSLSSFLSINKEGKSN